MGEAPRLWPRAVLHVDMDAFFASIEQLDFPELRGKPVVVGGSPTGRGVVSAASYEARVHGVHSAMPMSQALRLCPQAILQPVRMDRYIEMSEKVHEIFGRYTPAIQPVSVDEAFLEITGCQRLFGPPETIARLIKAAIRAETGLTASVGIAENRFVAKIASDLEKPDGLVLIPAAAVLDRLAPLPVGRISGVGKVTRLKLEKLGIHTIGDLRAWPLQTLIDHFGQGGSDLYHLARGEDDSPVHDADPEKSLSNEVTLDVDELELEPLRLLLLELADKVAGRLRRAGLSGRTVQLKVRYDDFSTITRRLTFPAPISSSKSLYESALGLLKAKSEVGMRPIRLLGVGVSGLSSSEERQGSLFTLEGRLAPERTEQTERAVDQIRAKLGPDAIHRGSLLPESE